MEGEKFNIDKIREDFPVFRYRVYLDTAGYSPLSIPVMKAMNELLELRKIIIKDTTDLLNLWLTRVVNAKKEAAKLLNVKENEIGFICGTTHGINIVSNMLALKKGENVIVSNMDFPSMTVPYIIMKRKMGIKIKCVRNVHGKILLSEIEKAIDRKTRVINICSTMENNGFTYDLEDIRKLAEGYDCYVLVDAIQSLGALKFDVKKSQVHFLASGAYKWLCGPFGIGIFYCKEDLIEKFDPIYVGYDSIVRKKTLMDPTHHPVKDYGEFKKTADKFAFPEPSFEAIWGLNESLKYINNLGIESIHERVLRLSDYLIENIQKIGCKVTSPLERKHRSGIITYTTGSYPRDLRSVREMDKIGINTSLRFNSGQGGIRVSTHFYNTEEDINKLVEAQKLFIKT